MTESKKYALITGASSGIGWQLSWGLAARGYSLVAVSNQAGALQSLKRDIETSHPVVVLTLECDLSEPGAAAYIYSYCNQEKLEVEVLVNNAGILIHGEALSVEVKQITQLLQLHMTTPVLLCRLFGSDMEKAGSGYILNVSSISAVMPFPTISLYGPTKGFLRGFTRALRMEMQGSGVSVTCLIPGATATALYDPEKLNLPRLVRLGIMKRPEVVARSGLKALFRGRPERVTGFGNKVIISVVPLIPWGLLAFIYRKTKERQKFSQ